jgi:hypothetical protein
MQESPRATVARTAFSPFAAPISGARRELSLVNLSRRGGKNGALRGDRTVGNPA